MDALRLGLRVVCWDMIAEDWRDDPPEVMLPRIYQRLRRGSIVLFHDTLYSTIDERYSDRGPTLATVERLLQDLGDRFVTVPELLKLGRPVRWHWYQRSRLDWLKQVKSRPELRDLRLQPLANPLQLGHRRGLVASGQLAQEARRRAGRRR